MRPTHPHRNCSQKAPSQDVLQLLLEAQDEAGEPMKNEEIRDQIMTLVLAGHETTATGSTWAIERLLRHRNALEALRQEAIEGKSHSYATAVVNETLRVRTPLWCLARVTTAPFQLGECVIPSNTTVIVYFPVIHRNPVMYPNPESFRPERFLETKPDLWAWMPFGGGAHRCIGEHFTIRMSRLRLIRLESVRLLRSFDVAAHRKNFFRFIAQLLDRAWLRSIEAICGAVRVTQQPRGLCRANIFLSGSQKRPQLV